MPTPEPHRNRGPAAAPRNREALLAAARVVFAEQGYRAPLNAIARAAGVGQGVLYRHFPDRLSLALAVFADNFAELERLIEETPGPEAFLVAWDHVVAATLASRAFVEMVIDARSQVPETLGSERLEHVLAEPLDRAQKAGLVDATWTPHDVLLLQHMVYGVIITQLDPADAPGAVSRALELVDPRLTPSPGVASACRG